MPIKRLFNKLLRNNYEEIEKRLKILEDKYETTNKAMLSAWDIMKKTIECHSQTIFCHGNNINQLLNALLQHQDHIQSIYENALFMRSYDKPIKEKMH